MLPSARPAGDGGPPSPCPRRGATRGARAAFDGAWNALVVWARSEGAGHQIQATSRPAGGAWGVPETLSGADEAVGGLGFGLDASGNAVVAWGRSQPEGVEIRAVLRPAGGSWGAPETASPAEGGASVSDLSVAIDATGGVIATWTRSINDVLGDRYDFSVPAAVRPSGGAWGAPERLSGSGPGGGTGPRLAVAADGDAVVVWNGVVGNFARIQAAARPPNGAWGVPKRLSADGQSAGAADVGIDGAGNAVAVWQRSLDGGILVPLRVQAALRLADAPQGSVPGAPRCRPLPAAPAGDAEDGASFALTPAQLRINQRIAQAGIRRLNAVTAWLDAGIQGGDLCGGAIGSAKLAAAITARRAAAAAPEPRLPSARQLLINQRIAQAVVRRANALERRLAGRLTGGDLAPGAVGAAELAPLLRIIDAAPSPDPAPSRTAIAPSRRGSPGAVRLTPAQLRVNQRISQAGVRRANALIARLEAGLTDAAFADGSITARNLAPEDGSP